MPHKHKRRHKDESVYDLPPTKIAKPLPAKEPQQKDDAKKKKNKLDKYATSSATVDDTPKAFARLMRYHQMGKRMPKGLDDPDDSSKKNKKRKRDAAEDGGDHDDNNSRSKKSNTSASSSSSSDAIPKIMPGEKLSDFAARVDQALPLSGIKKSRKPAASDLPEIREERVTKHEKRLRRLQQQWREEEKRIREREEEEREEMEAQYEEQLELWKQWEAEAGKGKAKKKGKGKKKKKKGRKGEDADIDDDDDPWAKLNNDRARAARPVNPADVVQAPPQLTKPKEVFKVRGGAKVDVANVPAAAGSLRRREELAEERKSIVEQYRRLMAEKRQQG